MCLAGPLHHLKRLALVINNKTDPAEQFESGFNLLVK